MKPGNLRALTLRCQFLQSILWEMRGASFVVAPLFRESDFCLGGNYYEQVFFHFGVSNRGPSR